MFLLCISHSLTTLGVSVRDRSRNPHGPVCCSWGWLSAQGSNLHRSGVKARHAAITLADNGDTVLPESDDVHHPANLLFSFRLGSSLQPYKGCTYLLHARSAFTLLARINVTLNTWNTIVVHDATECQLFTSTFRELPGAPIAATLTL